MGKWLSPLVLRPAFPHQRPEEGALSLPLKTESPFLLPPPSFLISWPVETEGTRVAQNWGGPRKEVLLEKCSADKSQILRNPSEALL